MYLFRIAVVQLCKDIPYFNRYADGKTISIHQSYSLADFTLSEDTLIEKGYRIGVTVSFNPCKSELFIVLVILSILNSLLWVHKLKQNLVR